MKVWKYGDDVNTDMLFPGKYTYTCSKPEQILPHLLEDLDPAFAKEAKAGDVIFAGKNFGCGSSREQPALGLKSLGIKAIVACSFARIFFRASINQGLVLIECPAAATAYKDGDPVELNIPAGKIVVAGKEYSFPKLPPELLAISEAGGLLEYAFQKIAARGPMNHQPTEDKKVEEKEQKVEWSTNAAGRKIPTFIPTFGFVRPFKGAFATPADPNKGATIPQRQTVAGKSKLVGSLKEALMNAKVKSGMVVTFHHHLREGDAIVNMTVKLLAEMGCKDLVLASSALFEVHKELLPFIKDGTVRRNEGSMNGAIGRLVSTGGMKDVAILRSHGGRARALLSGDLPVDLAVVAAPAADEFGNCNGVLGPNACGPLGYAMSDVRVAKHVIVVTDYLVPFPCLPVSISSTQVDQVVAVDSIGNHDLILSGTTEPATTEPGVTIAKYAAQLVYDAGYLKNGCSVQAGAGGMSLATMMMLQERMEKEEIKGGWGMGGATAELVKMLEKGLITAIFDVQSFDLASVQSIAKNPNHVEISADAYANPHNGGCFVHQLDAVVLGATEVDVHFNANVNTHSDGYLLHGIGGHQDTAAGAKLAIITCPTARKINPIILDEVTTITTPGECIDAIVTEEGVAINPARKDLLEKLKDSTLPLKTIEELRAIAVQKAGRERCDMQVTDKIVAVIEWRDGTVLDVVRQVVPKPKP